MEQNGYWGKRTATIDWCESNYEVSRFIAEFWNTISNLVMILLPLYAIYWSFKHRQFAKRNKFKKHFQVPKSTIYCQIGLLIVGIGSWMFHMTLLYPMQLLDELPMLYCAGLIIYANFDLILDSRKFDEKKISTKSKSALVSLIENRFFVFSIIFIYCGFCTFFYMSVWKNPVFHEVANGVQVFFIIITNICIVRKFKTSTRILKLCTFYYFLGFFFWNLDNHFCDYLKSARSFIDIKFSINESSNFKLIIDCFAIFLKSLFQFHSIWHVFTGFGSYLTILFTLEGTYQLHLAKTKNNSNEEKIIDLKYSSMYYHLSNDLMEKRDRDREQ